MKYLIYATSIAAFSLCSLAHAASPEARVPNKHRAFFKTHCLDCHDSETQEGKVDLETLPFRITTLEQAERWQKVLNALNAGEMPPEDFEQPGNAEKADVLDDLAQTMVAARKTLSDSGGKITMRRLNRREYRNTIGYLTGVKVDVASLPSDGGSRTFDTVGSSQFISSDQIEQYLKIGRSAIDESFERQSAMGQKTKVFRVEPETTVNVESAKAIRQLEKAYDQFMRWKAGVDKAAAAPDNREIMVRILRENPTYDLSAFPAAAGYQFYRHAQELIGAPDPNDFGFTDDNKAVFSFQGGYQRKHAYLKHYAELPHNDRGTYLKLAWGIQRIDVLPNPKDVPAGTYKLRIRAGKVEGSDPSRHFIELGHPQRVNQVPAGFSSLPLSSHQVTGTIENPEIIEKIVEIGADTPREFGIQEKQSANKKSLRNGYNRDKRENGYGTPPAIWVDWIELEGPLSESATGTQFPLQAILAEHIPRSGSRQDFRRGTSNPTDTRRQGETETLDEFRYVSDETERARVILSEFAETAFRGAKPDREFIDRLANIFATRRKTGDSFDTAIRLPLSIILASPGFLYLNEPTDVDERRQLTDRELAVRMAYFLWSAPPDQELLDLAKQQKLSQPEVLRQQIDRLIADSRSDEFVSGFVHQWLDMERLDFFQFDTTLHPEFDESTRSAARKEVYHSFAHLLRANGNPTRKRGTESAQVPRSRSGLPESTPDTPGRLGKLLKSDYVIINGLLANYYGIDGVTGDEFQKVKLPADSPRGGLLGMAAIHAMGSDGIVSSPVERGAWVLRHLLHDPPPPAPPNVPQISRLEGEILTTRQRLLAHQEEAQCASCHRKIDPIGLGLENFSAVGKWRTEDSYQKRNSKGRGVGKRKTWAIDASGAFHKGPAFADYRELRDLIAEREEDFARGFTEHLIEYALGRPFGFTDEALANEIVSSAKSKQFTLSEFVHSLVPSKAFRTKNSANAKQPEFESELFKTGVLVYSDDFDGEFNRDRWGAPKKNKSIKDGKLIVTSLFTSREEAMKTLKRDHHLGLEPVVHLNRVPNQFVCHQRYKFEAESLTPSRPVLQIGHHMILLNYLEDGGHRIKLPGGPAFTEPESGMKLGEWLELVIEYKKGEIRIVANGYSKTYKHEALTIINAKDKLGPRFTFKGGPNCRIVFDSVRLWECEE